MIDPSLYESLLASLSIELKGSRYFLQYINTSIIEISSASFM